MSATPFESAMKHLDATRATVSAEEHDRWIENIVTALRSRKTGPGLTLSGLPEPEHGADEGASYGYGYMVKIEYNTEADGTPVDESVPGEYPTTLHGPFDTEDEAVAWMDTYPDGDTDLHEIQTAIFNRVRPRTTTTAPKE